MKNLYYYDDKYPYCSNGKLHEIPYSSLNPNIRQRKCDVCGALTVEQRRDFGNLTGL